MEFEILGHAINSLMPFIKHIVALSAQLGSRSKTIPSLSGY